MDCDNCHTPIYKNMKRLIRWSRLIIGTDPRALLAGELWSETSKFCTSLIAMDGQQLTLTEKYPPDSSMQTVENSLEKGVETQNRTHKKKIFFFVQLFRNHSFFLCSFYAKLFITLYPICLPCFGWMLHYRTLIY